jgi:hypothetical protein
MLIGAIDPLEGSLVILPAIAIVAIGGFLGKSRYRVLLYWACILAAFGVAALFVISAFGGMGSRSGHSMWWGLFILPYPAAGSWVLLAAFSRCLRGIRSNKFYFYP